MLAAGVVVLLALLLLAGCGGEDEVSEGAYKCDTNEPSIIPAPSGKPQHVYFFKDT